MEAKVKACILNAHDGSKFYPAGQKRLKNSLAHHGFNWDFLGLEGSAGVDTKGRHYWAIQGVRYYMPTNTGLPGEEQHAYTIKIAAFEHAIALGYKVILWLDCSVWAIQNPNPFMDILLDKGYYLWKSGFSIGETANDRCLEYFGLTRHEALEIPDSSTSMIGLNLYNPDVAKFYQEWKQSAIDGIFKGGRSYYDPPKNGQKVAHRYDQSAASCLVHKYGFDMHDPGIYSSYANDKGEYADSVVFVMRGM